MYSESTNLIKVLFGTISVALVFLFACAFVFFCLPADGANNVVEISAIEKMSAGKSSGNSVSACIDSDDDSAFCEEDEVEELGFMADFQADADVGGIIDFGDYESCVDSTLVLYRNAQSRSAVEWFFTQITQDRDVAVAILDACSKYDVSPALAFALAYTESRYKTNVKHTNVNGSIDRGLFQLNNYSFPNLSEDDFYDASISANYGMAHLNYCIDAAGNEIAGLAMYNAGRNKVQSDKTPVRTLNYISQIENYKEKLENKFASEILAFYSDGSGNGNNYYLARY